MSKNKINPPATARVESSVIEIKSKVSRVVTPPDKDPSLIASTFQFDAEFRRWSFRREQPHSKFEQFSKQVAELHRLANNDLVLLSYIDPQDNDLLPINNDDNFGRALKTAKPLLRLIVQRKGKRSIT